MRAILLAATLLIAGPAMADALDESISSLKKDAPYSTARLPLFANGWVPSPEDKELDAQTRCSFRTEICLAYPETDGCSGTGMGYCSFRFEKDGAFLSITTVGEPVTDLNIADWRIDRP